MKKRLILTAVALICFAVVFTAVISAWYYISNRVARTEPVDIHTPPAIEIRDYEKAELYELGLDNLNIGETYRYVFSLTTIESDLFKNYTLKIIYTDNMNEDINLYKVERCADGVTGDYEYNGINYNYLDVVGGSEVIITPTLVSTRDGYTPIELPSVHTAVEGEYKQYDSSFHDTDHSTNPYNLYTDYYILEITWPSGSAGVDPKETDIVYIVAIGNPATSP